MANHKNFHCIHCGTKLLIAETGRKWPCTCPGCKAVTYANPKPVAVALVPVIGGPAGDKPGLLTVRRNIEPGLGEFALPAGFMEEENGENVEEAAARELREETGLDINPATARLLSSRTPFPGITLIMTLFPAVEAQHIDWTFSCDETISLGIWHKGQKLFFPIHDEAANLWLSALEAQLASAA